mmetsp:Transcript_54497/g.158324  ORF Transcript_54497/g.158324 Transcript_54497/m.158324 type:complete len:205 (+) Transcript_54497:215-829(+)
MERTTTDKDLLYRAEVWTARHRAVVREAPQVGAPMQRQQEPLLLRRVDRPRPGDAHPTEEGGAGDVQMLYDHAASQQDAAAEAALAMHQDGLIRVVENFTCSSEGRPHLSPPRATAIRIRDVTMLDAEGRPTAPVVTWRHHSRLLHSISPNNNADIACLEELGKAPVLRLQRGRRMSMLNAVMKGRRRRINLDRVLRRMRVRWL